MKRNNKKGFTIVELVIVIAVIAILAGVLIPTFAGIVAKANASKALQEAQNAYKEAYALAIADGKIVEKTAGEGEVVEVGNYQFAFKGEFGNLTAIDVKVLAGSDADDDGYAVTVTTAGVVSVAEVKGSVAENTTWAKTTDAPTAGEGETNAAPTT